MSVMDFILLTLLGIVGLCMGSFISAFSYRWPRRIDFFWGRSFCPNCKHPISWYDNIPLISYLLLGGKCRSCGKAISARYPLIEFGCASSFILLGYKYLNPSSFINRGSFAGVYFLPLLLLVFSLLIAIFVIDLENQLIPDSLVFILVVLISLGYLLSKGISGFDYLAQGFGASFFLLFLALITRGRGMGMGDVKLALPLGAILGWPQVAVWLLLSFLIGGIFAILLLVTGKARFGKRIAFGPFLVLGFIATLVWGEKIFQLINL